MSALALFRPEDVDEPVRPVPTKQPPKWGPGERLSLLAFDDALSRGKRFWWEGGQKPRVMPAAVVQNWSYRLVRRNVELGRLRLARVTDEYMDWLRMELLGGSRP